MFAVNKFLVRPSRSVGMSEFSPSRTVQSDKDRTDIRNIVKRAMRGGVVNVNVREGRFVDISGAPSYMEALGVVARANELFASLPAATRDRFNNDPYKMLAFLDDKENFDEAVKLGLRSKPVEAKPVEPMLVRVVPEEAAVGEKK